MNRRKRVTIALIISSALIFVAGGMVALPMGIIEFIFPWAWLFGDPSLKPNIVLDGSYNDAIDVHIFATLLGQGLLTASLFIKATKAKISFEAAGMFVLWAGYSYLIHGASDKSYGFDMMGDTLLTGSFFIICSLVKVATYFLPASSKTTPA